VLLTLLLEVDPATSQPLTPEEWGPSSYLDLWLIGELCLVGARALSAR
jgi:hypothetical protein